MIIEWMSINLFDFVLKVVSLQLGKSFVGYPLCRDQGWVWGAI